MSDKGHKSKAKSTGKDKSKTVRTDEPRPAKLGRKEYEKELSHLHAELVQVQHWVQRTGAKICIVFEGRDGAGKGGTIKAITDRVSPRVFRVVALPAPTEREKSQMYAQRYIPHLPAAGEIVIFDRSWYNLLKYWLEVSPEEQTRRLQDRINDPRKVWKLSPMDLKSYGRWYDYSRARDEMFAATDHDFAPWYVARSDDTKRARLNIIKHLLSKIPYERTKPEKIKLPKRQRRGGYREPEHPLRYVQERF